jgi:probable LLM family oxidoreductase
MQVGIDSFAAAFDDSSLAVSTPDRLRQLVEQIEHADQVGLDAFGVGEHHRKEFLDSAPAVILGAAAARTQRIRLTSAVTVLSAADPVRVFQEFATIDLLSQGRAEMVVGRGSSIEAFPLFGYRLEDYDSLFAEKLDLLLKIRDDEHLHWSGKYRPALTGQGIYPRPVQNPLPIWLGVGGTPQSFARAGALGLPLMVAIIGGDVRRFRPLIDLYRETGKRNGYAADRLRVGVHAPGYVAETTKEAADDFFPGYARAVTKVGKERGWPAMTRASFDAELTPHGALLIGSPDEVVEKIFRHSEALGGISRISFQMNAASLPHVKLMRAIEAIGARVAPALHAGLEDESHLQAKRSRNQLAITVQQQSIAYTRMERRRTAVEPVRCHSERRRARGIPNRRSSQRSLAPDSSPSSRLGMTSVNRGREVTRVHRMKWR